MDPTEQNNPAGRLYTIVSRAIEQSHRAPQMASGYLWAVVFELPLEQRVRTLATSPELYELVLRLEQLRKLIDETEERLRHIDGLAERYFRPFPKIRLLPQQSLVSLASNITTAIEDITEGDMTVLEFCAEKLKEQHAERIIDEGELKQILEDVSTLFNDVRQSNLDPELKTFILDELESIRRGIYEFRIRGPQRLKETLAEIIGTLAVNHDIIQAARDQDKGIVERFEKAFYRLAAAVSFAVDGPALLSAVNRLLPGGG